MVIEIMNDAKHFPMMVRKQLASKLIAVRGMISVPEAVLSKYSRCNIEMLK